MPIPKKKQNENQSAFMIRCVPQLMQYHPKDQALAMCYKAFKGGLREDLESKDDYPDLTSNNLKQIEKK
tara:strand:+ start:204 stop:410 length:207 start_codon:yes stop_codon:yes gene_type:complete